MPLIFIDLETTGLDPNKDEIIQSAYQLEGELLIHSNLHKPNKVIPYEISGLTNIDQKDVQDKMSFKDSKEKEELCKYAKKNYIAVAHNADFDMEFLKNNGVEFDNDICTLMLAKKLIGNKLTNLKQGTLRAYFKIPVPKSLNPHNALYDVEVLTKVFEKMKVKFQNINEMIKITKEMREEELKIWHFGKYKGQKINKEKHLDYIKWYLEQPENPKYKRDPKFIQLLKSME